MKQILLIAVSVSMIVESTAQTPYLLKDIYSGTNYGINSFERIIYNTNLLFVACDNSGNHELWKTDGTTANTSLVKDIAPGSTGSQINGFYIFNNTVFFEATNGANGSELWKTDGTTAGTVQVKDIRAGSAGGFDNIYFQPVWVHGGSFFFLAETNGSYDYELWKSDGTTAGTVLVKDILPGSSSSDPQGFYEFNNQLFFEAGNGANGAELWKTDGTTNGTVQVKDIRAGSAGGFDYSYFSPCWVHAGSFFFRAETNDVYDDELWKSDGTTAGTVLVKDILPGSSSSDPQGFYEFNNQLFFEATNGANGYELWKTDGSTAGTSQVKDIRAGSAGGFDNYYFQPFWVHGGSFFFLAETNAAYDEEIWKSDGTTAGTVLVKDIQPGGTGSNPQGFYPFGNDLYFEANNGANGAELWKTDGSNAGTLQVKDIRSGSAGGFDNYYFQPFWVHGGSFFFLAETSQSYDEEIWKSDGTTAGTVLVKDIQPGGTGSNPQGFYPFGNDLYFEANNGANGAELWKTDGSTAGTVQVKDIRPGSAGGFDSEYFTPFIEWNGNFYFKAETNAGYDDEIWKCNGTTPGTVLVQDIYSGTTGSDCWAFTILNNTYLIFAATNGAYGQELWAMNMPGLTTEIEDEDSKIHAFVFPNPSNGKFNLELETEKSEPFVLEIFDMSGKRIYLEDLEPAAILSKEIDLTNFEKGIYLVRIESAYSTAALRVMIY